MGRRKTVIDEFFDVLRGFSAHQQRFADEPHQQRFADEPEPETSLPEAFIPEARLKKLLILCHPDRHGNSELSQETTRWLIELKRELEQWTD